jgi:hypothetical protein
MTRDFPISGGRITVSRNNDTGRILAQVLETNAVVEISVHGEIRVCVPHGELLHVIEIQPDGRIDEKVGVTS